MSGRPVQYPLKDKVRQSPQIDTTASYNAAWVKNKTILITGGASGFGAGYFKHWAANGANVIIGDINVEKGDQLVREIRKETGNQDLHFMHCDVSSWQSQVNFFREAIKFSTHGGIDTVVANAGIADPQSKFERPMDLDAAEPPPPSLKVIDVNLTGVIYTTHLALHYLPLNPNSVPASPLADLAATHRDRHLLLVGSLASLSPITSQALYGAAKHGVLGLFRCLRSSSFTHGVRVNIICPYFIDTPLLGADARAVLAGGSMGKIEDVVEAATRFAADPRIVGRALVVGPKLRVEKKDDGEWDLVKKSNVRGEERSIWEIYADDFEDSEIFQRRMVGLLNAATELRGWIGWASDMVGAVGYAVGGWWRS
ncbi:MAG: hypothetical protein M1830_009831 [Pleopsidium flavum]|nr:MAG: hypothetical protein M1830_009831 [Pleopsidium flavum]